MNKRMIPVMATVVVLLLVVAILSSCDWNNGVASDGYKFEEVDHVIEEPVIQLTLYKSEKEILDAYEKSIGSKRKLGGAESLVAFSSVNRETGFCMIHTVDPVITYQPEFLGHELVHCLYGNFHKKRDARTSG